MKSQAFVEQMGMDEVELRINGRVYSLPRCCLPAEVQEEDVIDMVVFVNEKATQRHLDQIRRWLRLCGAYAGMRRTEEAKVE